MVGVGSGQDRVAVGILLPQLPNLTPTLTQISDQTPIRPDLDPNPTPSRPRPDLTQPRPDPIPT